MRLGLFLLFGIIALIVLVWQAEVQSVSKNIPYLSQRLPFEIWSSRENKHCVCGTDAVILLHCFVYAGSEIFAWLQEKIWLFPFQAQKTRLYFCCCFDCLFLPVVNICRIFIFTTRYYVSMVYAVIVCLCVCLVHLSHAITGSHIHWISGNISEIVLDRDVSLKVGHLVQTFPSAIFCICDTSRGCFASAELLVLKSSIKKLGCSQWTSLLHIFWVTCHQLVSSFHCFTQMWICLTLFISKIERVTM